MTYRKKLIEVALPLTEGSRLATGNSRLRRSLT